jgi:hypothetical protein
LAARRDSVNTSAICSSSSTTKTFFSPIRSFPEHGCAATALFCLNNSGQQLHLL